MSITTLQILYQLFSEIPGSGLVFDAASVMPAGASTITTIDPRLSEGGANANPQKYVSKYLLRPTLAAADQIRAPSTLSVSGGTATLAFLGSYADTTTLTDFVLSILPLADWLEVINTALEYEFTEYEELIAHGPADYDLSDDTAWTEANATDTVHTTAADTYTGIGGMTVVDSGSGGGYTRSGVVRVVEGERIVYGGIWKSDTGTGEIVLRDGSNNSLGSISHAFEQFIYGRDRYDVATGVEELKLDLEGATASADIDFDSVFIVRCNDRILYLPSWLDRRPKAISKAVWGNEVSSNLYPAYSRRLEQLIEDEDYRFFYRAGEANPGGIELLKDGLMDDGPLWLTADRPYSDFGTLTAYNSTTNIAMKTIIPRCKWLLGNWHPQTFPELTGGAEPVAILNQRHVHTTSEPKHGQRAYGPRNVG